MEGFMFSFRLITVTVFISIFCHAQAGPPPASSSDPATGQRTAASASKVTIAYTGKTFGYLRDPDIQPAPAAHGNPCSRFQTQQAEPTELAGSFYKAIADLRAKNDGVV